jgi:hypothetical protein
MPKLGTSMIAALVAPALALAAARPARAADPTTADCLGASEGSIALRNDHKLRAARAQLLVCSAASCPADIRAECARRVGEINVAIPTIVFEVKDPTGHDLTAVRVMMDGQPLAERLEGIALSIDPGEHAFSFETAGQPPLETRLVIREGEKDRRERIAFGAPAAVAGTTGGTAAATGATLAASGSAPSGGGANGANGANGDRSLGNQRIGAIAAAAVGVVGLGVGIGFGLSAMSKHDDAAKICPSSSCPDQHGVDLWNQAVSAGNVSTAAFVVGAVALAGGAVLWFTAKPAAHGGEPGVSVGLGPGGLSIGGTW